MAPHAPMPIGWTPRARRAMEHLPEKVATAAAEFIYGPLADNPQRVGKPLRFEMSGLHGARRGDYRVIYRIGGQVTILAVEHRSDVYRPR